MRIALDAMGSDNRPTPDVAGAVDAARAYGDTILLVGDDAQIKTELAKHETAGLKLEIVPAAEVIGMEDKPSMVARSKPDSSMHVGMNFVKEGNADAFVTCGNTGAALAIATLRTLRRIPGVSRPALSTILRLGGHEMILTDIGANADCKPEWLYQFAVMGNIYAQRTFNQRSPRVALLSNGEEEGKGNQLIQDAARLLSGSQLNFVGNVEPKEVLSGGADVIIADGFVGNIMIKSIEAALSTMQSMLRAELTSSLPAKIGALLSRPAFRRVGKQLDPFEIGGAPLLGVNGVVIIGHGRTNALGVMNAIRQARQAVEGGIIEAIQEDLHNYAIKDDDGKDVP